MTIISEEEFEASIEKYHNETYSFRQMLDNRAEEEIVRDDYVLAQKYQWKRMKVVLMKASKKLKLPDLAPGSPNYPNWLNYYENLIRVIIGDMKIEAYYKDKAERNETEGTTSGKDQPPSK
jgi:hypothetical protein